MKVTVKSNNISINNNNKYKVVVNGYNTRLRLSKDVKNRKVSITKISNVGGQTKYQNDEERRLAHNKQSLSSYHNNPRRVKYRKDTDRTYSINNKESIVKATKEFYSEHYQFNYFLSLQHGFILDSWDKKASKTSEDYQYIRQQDKYQVGRVYSLDQCVNEAIAYINRLTKNGIPIFDNWYLTIHKSRYDNSYHAHIALNVINTTIVNVHTYLANRWHKSKRKKQMVKKIYNLKEAIGYMNEELKNINGHTVYTECNIDRHSNRLFGQDDINRLEYTINTFDHPLTQSKLQQFKKTG